MPLTGERASSPIGSKSSSGDTSVSAALGTNWRAMGSCAGSPRSIKASISGVMAIAIDWAAAARRGSGVSSPSRSRASSVRRVCMAALNSLKRSFQPVRKTTIIRAEKGRGWEDTDGCGATSHVRRAAALHAVPDRPAALLLGLFQVLPIAIGANASFRDWALYNPKKTWVGLDHYRAVITDPAFLEVVLPNTFIFMVLSVAGDRWSLGLALALLLNRPFRGQKIVQTVLLVPLMVAPVIAAIMMRWMFNDQFGIVNAVLEGLGLEGQPWLVERWSAFGIIVLTDIWLWTPWFTLLLLAGLQSLPREPFEAAAIDGTSTWRVFSHLTLPMLRPVIVVCIVIRAIDAFRTFDIVWTLTGGGPGRSTELFSLYAYVLAFLNLDFGRGSAAAIIGGLIILVVGVVLYRVVDRIAKA